ncbi:hypothetical protein [Litchfieldella xinjiangensis]|uniref:hypothetical protein n=1 Tax=Litchfieldella xinjiangensis TaxID=1166948 RepID=UPI0005BA4457|nr:hypothetical protein [Halomonas xinjiangensis]
MLNWLKPAKPPRVWVVKQIDSDVLHLCGQGIVEGKQKHKEKLAALSRGHYQGPVRLASGGIVLNSALFQALIPFDDLMIDDDDQAHWRDRRFRIAWVPQRCWAYTGRLATQAVLMNGQPSLSSIEDVSGIRAKASPSAAKDHAGAPLFVPLDALGDDVPHRQKGSSNISPRHLPGGRSREWQRSDDDR